MVGSPTEQGNSEESGPFDNDADADEIANPVSISLLVSCDWISTIFWLLFVSMIVVGTFESSWGGATNQREEEKKYDGNDVRVWFSLSRVSRLREFYTKIVLEIGETMIDSCVNGDKWLWARRILKPDSFAFSTDDIARKKEFFLISIKIRCLCSGIVSSNRWPAVLAAESEIREQWFEKGSCRRRRPWEYPWLSREKYNAFHGIITPTAVTTTDWFDRCGLKSNSFEIRISVCSDLCLSTQDESSMARRNKDNSPSSSSGIITLWDRGRLFGNVWWPRSSTRAMLSLEDWTRICRPSLTSVEIVVFCFRMIPFEWLAPSSRLIWVDWIPVSRHCNLKNIAFLDTERPHSARKWSLLWSTDL